MIDRQATAKLPGIPFLGAGDPLSANRPGGPSWQADVLDQLRGQGYADTAWAAAECRVDVGLTGWAAARAQRSGARARSRSWRPAIDCDYEHVQDTGGGL
jgi:hypothetical protein